MTQKLGGVDKILRFQVLQLVLGQDVHQVAQKHRKRRIRFLGVHLYRVIIHHFGLFQILQRPFTEIGDIGVQVGVEGPFDVGRRKGHTVVPLDVFFQLKGPDLAVLRYTE